VPLGEVEKINSCICNGFSVHSVYSLLRGLASHQMLRRARACEARVFHFGTN
jgi:hypothetical protein